MPEIYSVHFNLSVSLLSPPFLVFSLFFFLRRSRRPISPFVRPWRTSFPSLDFFQLVPKILSDASGYHEHRPRFQSGFPRTRCNNLVSPYFRPRYSLTVVRVHLLVAVCSDSAAEDSRRGNLASILDLILFRFTLTTGSIRVYMLFVCIIPYY